MNSAARRGRAVAHDQDGSAEDNKIVAETITSIERMEASMASDLLHEATAELILAGRSDPASR